MLARVTPTAMDLPALPATTPPTVQALMVVLPEAWTTTSPKVVTVARKMVALTVLLDVFSE